MIGDYEARENMLRGCVGLNVTSFLFMMLVRGLTLLADSDKFSSWQDDFDLVRLRDVVSRVLESSHNVRDRLTADLASEDLGEEALLITTDFVQFVDADAIQRQELSEAARDRC